ncbi:SWR1-complex protein 4/DNA methyltransferase 1-associated protein 1 [Kalmanozyma brasiliensis GHG001]|uniref:SWR1-complex protein 4 n=1 Tax=Kalmanozyma brasiliensis (strain GHG001) TaxID=1365824 RepID=V5EHN9_KALBG|nr:SWR1-complex protein 4/DNA methyltransferase 1-associated protein 1 [Kalmanozyma brasiliensis GHG001]EST10111.1 SWR1-complex protein 4/DNA methyltransferase 1-associated protein 1 [Kalmanozyma brasiliensis GHG001]
MTSNDVRDILSLPERSGSRPSSSAQASSSRNRKSNPHPSTSRQKPKYDGMTRELFALLGDNAPTLAMAHGLDAGKPGVGMGGMFKPKFKRRAQPTRSWRWVPFLNSARDDTTIDDDTPEINHGLLLHHWAPEGKEEVETKYSYAEFNTTSGVYTYSNDEYIQQLRDDDWTKEETDYLMELCAAYDLRFVVIHDRYDWAAAQGPALSAVQPAKERSMEDLKARYYAICRRLIRSRISTDDVETRQLLLSTYAFDKQREVERKKAVARLYTRTPEQLAEEEALYVEIRRIEQNEAKYASEREELLRLLGGWESLPSSSPHAVAAAGAGIASSVGEDDAAKGRAGASKKRKLQVAEEGTPGAEDAPATTRPSATLTSKQRAEMRQAQFDEMQCIVRFASSASATVDNTGAITGAAVLPGTSATTAASAIGSTRPPYAHLVGTASTLPPTTTNPSNPSSGHGAYLRSSRMLAPRPNLVLRTTQVLAESEPPVGPRLIFPTAKNVEKWENLMGAVTTSLEMRKQLERVNAELRIAKQRIAAALQTGKGVEAGVGGSGEDAVVAEKGEEGVDADALTAVKTE